MSNDNEYEFLHSGPYAVLLNDLKGLETTLSSYLNKVLSETNGNSDTVKKDITRAPEIVRLGLNGKQINLKKLLKNLNATDNLNDQKFKEVIEVVSSCLCSNNTPLDLKKIKHIVSHYFSNDCLINLTLGSLTKKFEELNYIVLNKNIEFRQQDFFWEDNHLIIKERFILKAVMPITKEDKDNNLNQSDKKGSEKPMEPKTLNPPIEFTTEIKLKFIDASEYIKELKKEKNDLIEKITLNQNNNDETKNAINAINNEICDKIQNVIDLLQKRINEANDISCIPIVVNTKCDVTSCNIPKKRSLFGFLSSLWLSEPKSNSNQSLENLSKHSILGNL